jgi:hypothetical protein
MNQPTQTQLDYSAEWIDIIKQSKKPNKKQAEWIIEESLHNFAEYFNKGWLENRKSVTQ